MTDVYTELLQENSELKTKVFRLEQENKELKELNKKICEDWEKEIKAYWNTLEEIREIVKPYLTDCQGSLCEPIDEVLNKINEVLNLS